LYATYSKTNTDKYNAIVNSLLPTKNKPTQIAARIKKLIDSITRLFF